MVEPLCRHLDVVCVFTVLKRDRAIGDLQGLNNARTLRIPCFLRMRSATAGKSFLPFPSG